MKKRYTKKRFIPKKEKIVDSKLEKVFAALASQHRQDIIYLLSFQAYSITGLAELLELSLPALHKHVKILEESKIISRQKISRTNFLTLNRNTLNLIKKWFEEKIKITEPSSGFEPDTSFLPRMRSTKWATRAKKSNFYWLSFRLLIHRSTKLEFYHPPLSLPNKHKNHLSTSRSLLKSTKNSLS